MKTWCNFQSIFSFPASLLTVTSLLGEKTLHAQKGRKFCYSFCPSVAMKLYPSSNKDCQRNGVCPVTFLILNQNW